MENKLKLRTFSDDDITTFEKWLITTHVKPWYENPESWLEEIKKRKDKFSFIKHFIAEYNGKPIGFCQYYDMFYGQEYEDWLPIAEPNNIYSIDYLIGESEYLKMGLGQSMIALLLDLMKKEKIKTVIVRPDLDNYKSNRVLEKNGFKWNGTDYILEL